MTGIVQPSLTVPAVTFRLSQARTEFASEFGWGSLYRYGPGMGPGDVGVDRIVNQQNFRRTRKRLGGQLAFPPTLS